MALDPTLGVDDLDDGDAQPRAPDASVVSRLKDLLGVSPGIQLRNLTTESDFSLQTSKNLGKYVIEREIGRGGMGRVYLAFDRDLKRRIAIKVVSPDLASNREHLARFVEEAQITGQLEHPAIPPVHELALDEGGNVFFTLKLLKGRTLKDIIQDLHIRRRETLERFSRIRLLMILQSVCNAVHFAHEKGVVHRDIKPDNIMIGDYGDVQLMDWGLAKVLDAPEREPIEDLVETVRAEQGFVTLDGRVFGTLQYMAPEQAIGRNDEIEREADIYALGATLYEMLTLVPPRTGATPTELLEECRLGLVIPPAARAPRQKVPAALEEICLKAMELRPEDRYPTALEMAEAIQNFIDGSREEERKRAESQRCLDEARKVLRDYRASLLLLKETQARYDTEGQAAGNRPSREAQDRQRQLRSELETRESQVARSYTEAQTLLAAALSANPENRQARNALGELYLERFLRADAEGIPGDVIFYQGLIEQVNDGQFDDVLRGHGSLTIECNVQEAKFTLRRYEDDQGILVPSTDVADAQGRLEIADLPMGSYLLSIDGKGFCPLSYPIRVRRNEQIHRRVRLYEESRVPSDLVVVAVGEDLTPPVRSDTSHAVATRQDSTENDAAAPPRDFAIGVHPVTCAEYLEFLNHLAATDLEEARRRAPRLSADEGFLWTPDGGRFVLPEPETYPWSARLPVFAINFDDAIAYCRFRSERDGRDYDVPTEGEWERAARGADERHYSWGNDFDYEYCNGFYAREGKPGVVTVDEYPQDTSPYGVRGMVGNVLDWCYFDDSGSADAEMVAVRGGNWALNGEPMKLFKRRPLSRNLVSDRLGFRLVLRLDPGDA